jgi:uncharacterized membrane protein (UPF0127 family)
MMKKRINLVIKNNSKKVRVKNVKKLKEFEKAIGLMFRRKEKCPLMLFEFKKPINKRIHSLFVFFKFAAIWLDKKNNVIDKKIVKPFRFSVGSKKVFYKLLEIPLNKNYSKEIKLLFKNSNFYR